MDDVSVNSPRGNKEFSLMNSFDTDFDMPSIPDERSGEYKGPGNTDMSDFSSISTMDEHKVSNISIRQILPNTCASKNVMLELKFGVIPPPKILEETPTPTLSLLSDIYRSRSPDPYSPLQRKLVICAEMTTHAEVTFACPMAGYVSTVPLEYSRIKGNSKAKIPYATGETFIQLLPAGIVKQLTSVM